MRIVDMPGHRDKKELLILDKETPLLEAIKRMKKLSYGAVIVADHDKLCGIFTERDLLMKVVAEDKDIGQLKLMDVMSVNVQTAKVDDPVYDAMRRMSLGKFRHLPIVDDEGNIMGLVSQGDFAALTWQQLFFQLKEKTRGSFNAYTQFWVFAIALTLYVTIMIKILK